MLKYIFRRVLIFIPTLFLISLIAFVISLNAPGDPIENLVTAAQGGESGSALSDNLLRAKDSLRHQLGLDLPVFYFTITSAASPDSMYKITDKNQRESLERLVDNYGNWDQISVFFEQLKKLNIAARSLLPDSNVYKPMKKETAEGLADVVENESFALMLSHDEVVIISKFNTIRSLLNENKFLGSVKDAFNKAYTAFENMRNNASRWKNWIPQINFFGYNQYHRWMFGDGNWLTGKGSIYTAGVIRGDFGLSYATRQAVTKTIKRAVPWSMTMTLLSVMLAYLISIPVGIHAAANRGKLFDRASSVVLFMLYSLPPFFIGTLLLITFANPDMLDWFEANGVKPATGYPEGASLWEKINISGPYLVLPLVSYTYSSLAFLSRTMRVAMLEVINQDYIRTARAKGLTPFLVVYKHGLRNALLPIITVFSNIFPAAIGGSIILEYIFGIPGMGQEIIQAIHTKDYPMIIAVFTLSGFMTLIGYLFADIMYAIVDPRISYSSK
ncbi:MAG: peptide/nickel transport system permease protein [Bacteroidetes bacterium]|nr:MAG: peptide/nickel transport system permease protein [Bacteroidota bacterium]